MDVNQLTTMLNKSAVDFNEVIQVIDEHYHFTPCAFQNGDTHNEANTNNGSCKVFGFGKLHNLSQQATLNAFGLFYTKDVLQNSDGDDHQNIRNFMKTGWDGINFEDIPLKEKNK